MAIQIQGNGGVVAEVSTDFRALRSEARPTDTNGRGAYSYAGFTGILPAALAANSEIFQFRWTDATRLAVIRGVTISAVVSTTFFAAGVPVQIDLVRSTGWSASGSGGTAITPSTLLKRRSSMASSLVGDMRIATTAALGAGTKTLDTYALSAVAAPGPITSSLNGLILPPTVLIGAEIGDGEHPLVLTTNEGFSIRSVDVPATGTWTAAIRVDWTEVTSF